jgi:hypothetical protein
MEFMRGDINDFIDNISGYKSTISIGLGTITMLVNDFLLFGSLLTRYFLTLSGITQKSPIKFFKNTMR